MATSIEQILGKDINSLKELREEIKRLQDSIANVDPATQEFTDTTQKLIAAQNQLTSVTRASKDANVAAEDSIVGMERQYKSLYNTYKMLTEEQRNSPFGTEMATQLDGLSKKLNDTKKNVGNFKDNIGHYSEGVIDAFSKMGISVGGMAQPLKLAAGGIKTLGASLKALIANPVGAVIMAIVVALKALKAIADRVKEAINANEESQMALSEAMSAFQPILDGVKNAWDAVGQAVVKVIGFIGDAVRWIREAGAAVTDFLGITKGANERIKEQNELYKGLAKAQNQLTKQKREYQKLNAKDQAEVERLREEASETNNLEEKRKLLTEAKAKQAEIDARNIELAKEELRIMQEQAKLTANSAEDNEKLAAAEAKVSQAEADAARNARTFNKALKATTTSTNDAANAAKKLAEEAKKVYEDSIENSKDELTKLKEDYEKKKKLLENHGYDTTLLTKQYEEKKTNIIQNEMVARIQKIKNYEDWVRSLYSEGKTPAELEIERMDDAAPKIQKYSDELNQMINEKFNGLQDLDAKSLKLLNDFMDGWSQRLEAETGLKVVWPSSDDISNTEAQMEEFKKHFHKAWLDFVDDAKLQIQVGKEKLEKFLISGIISISKDNRKVGLDLLGVSPENFKDYEDQFSKFMVFKAEANDKLLQHEKQFLETQLQFSALDTETRIDYETRLYNIREQLRQQDWAKEEILWNLKFEKWQEYAETVSNVGDSINSVLSSIVSLKEADIDAEQKEGKITEKEAAKKKKALLSYQKVMTAVEVASIAASTASGIMGVWKAYALEKIANAETAAATGPAAAATLAALNAKSLASAILQTAGMAAAGAAQITAAISGTIAKGKALDAEVNTAGGASTVATPTTIASEPYTYSRTIQTQDDVDELATRPLFVSVVDINNMQQRVRVTENESTF